MVVSSVAFMVSVYALLFYLPSLSIALPLPSDDASSPTKHRHDVSSILVDSTIPVYPSWDHQSRVPLRNEYAQIGDYFRDYYLAKDPFPHIYIDNLYPRKLINEVASEFPRHAAELGDGINHGWGVFMQDRQVYKYHLNDEELMGPAAKELIRHMKSAPFVAFLERLTGIQNLLVDVDNFGGGLHQIGRGGLLGVHTDFNKHPRLGLWRRVNAFMYLNEDWEESFGGHLELWDRNMTNCGARILPSFNRLAVFSASRISLHGHPHPLNCPPHRSRRSIAMYYYTNYPGPTDAWEDKFINTVFYDNQGSVEFVG
jgi:Rps23 Pro-64 3,4-dihydroxylase Tpa1-like proline 4-hydroxylase